MEVVPQTFLPDKTLQPAENIKIEVPRNSATNLALMVDGSGAIVTAR